MPTSMRRFATVVLLLLVAAFVVTGCSAASPNDADDGAATVGTEQSLDARAAVGDWIQTPFGRRHKSCVHEVADGSRVGEDGTITRPDGSTFRLPKCAYPVAAEPPPSTDGWVASRSWFSPKWVKKMTADFRVPSAPSRRDALVYLFPGLEPYPVTTIEQPVLAYGYGGPGWTMASWSCGDPCVHSPIKSVSAGDELHGAMTGTDCTSGGHCAWTVVTKDVSKGTSTVLSVAAQPPMYWVFGGVLEAYGVSACDEYPANGSVSFTTLRVYDRNLDLLTPAFSQDGETNTQTPHCGMQTSGSTSHVTISHMCKAQWESCVEDDECCLGSCFAGLCQTP